MSHQPTNGDGQPLDEIPVFPSLTFEDVLCCQFSSWYPLFEKHTIRAKIIRPLSQEFLNYLDADGISVPDDSEDQDTLGESSDQEEEESEGDNSEGLTVAPRFSFPELTANIRAAISSFGAVFPKLNWTSPRDANWILTPSTPLKCTSPSDVYLFLKSSDFVSHDLDSSKVFDGCIPTEGSASQHPPAYQLELVLKKWYLVETSRELRCFVRGNNLIGISQRDATYYEFLNETDTNRRITQTVASYWNNTVKPLWIGGANYVLDLLLTRDLARAHVIDFNPYASRTDALLFTYEELRDLYISCISSESASKIPEFRVISSRAHPAASRTAPQHIHNMIPREALELSAGRTILDFQQTWAEQLSEALQDRDGSLEGEEILNS